MNGQNIPFSRYGQLGSWHYDGPRLTLVIDTPHLSTKSIVTIKVINGSRGKKKKKKRS